MTLSELEKDESKREDDNTYEWIDSCIRKIINYFYNSMTHYTLYIHLNDIKVK